MSSVCVECARSKRRGCCWANPETRYEETYGISVADVQRIAKATGKKPSEFLNVERVSSDLREAISYGYPDLFRVMKGNIRLSLKSDEGGTCTLMGPQGCTLSREDRPRVCSTYPTHYEAIGKSLVLKADALSDRSACLALKRADGSASKLYRILSSSERETRKLAEKAHAEAVAHDLMSVHEIVSAVNELG